MTRSVEIPPEVVEKSAHAMYADNEVGEWENGHLDTLLQYRRAARIAVEAAAPYLTPEIVVDHRPGESCSVVAEVDPETGFARAPAVPQPACLGDGVCTNPRCPKHGVQGSAVPQPVDREALAKRIAQAVAAVIGPDVRFVHNGATERVHNAIIDRRSNQITDAVLAVLAGEPVEM